MAAIGPREIPCRVEKIERPAPERRHPAAAPADERRLPLPRRPVHRLPAEGRKEAQLLDRQSAAARSVTALELHVRHTPGGAFTDQVFGALKVRDLLRFEGPLDVFRARERTSDRMLASGTACCRSKAYVRERARTRDDNG